MKSLRLIPSFHKQEAVIKAAFTSDNELISLVKAQKGVRWSQTLKSWYFPKKNFQLHVFYQALKGKVFIYYSQLNQTSPPVKKTTSVPLKSRFKLPKRYSEQLILKRYRPNIIKTYSSCFLKFLLFFENQKLETIGKKEIKRFLLYLVEKEKVSASNQNQYINAIKFYYEKGLGQSKMIFKIERPSKEKLLPKVLSKNEVTRLIHCIKNIKHRAIVRLIYFSGLRMVEVLRLSLKDIHSKRGIITINGGKDNKDRISILYAKVLKLLREYVTVYQCKTYLFEDAKKGFENLKHPFD